MAESITPALAGFPAGTALETPLPLKLRGIALRPCTASDLGFLRELYHQLRAAELARVPWPPAHKTAFLDSQFGLQHKHYLTHFSSADFLLIEADGGPVGRFYLSRQAGEFLIVDISLLQQWRNSGIGTALIRHAQTLAQAVESSLNLHVDVTNNAARRLYQRLGFVATLQDGPYTAMRWTAATES
ncbi:MAG: GNAT family N-acetyltransferase [Collimonas sp.]|uniref:GNAT family N-acetyltransferase n=1 Tax=Collimonas sp. TaxID=1963772 RepID=UPI0032668C0C